MSMDLLAWHDGSAMQIEKRKGWEVDAAYTRYAKY